MKIPSTFKNVLLVAVLLVGAPTMQAQETTGATTMTLKEAIAYAMENSYSMDYADMDVRAARRRNKELTAVGLPQINGDVSFTNYLKLPTTVIPAQAFNPAAPEGTFEEIQFGTDYNVTATLAASQLIFDGTYIIGLKAAKKYTELNVYAKQQTESEVRQSIIEAYGLAVVSVRSHQLTEENYNNLESLLRETEKLYENGFREELDVDQLRLQLQTLDNSRTQSERNVHVTHNLLKFQMGMPVATELVLTSSLNELAEISEMPELLDQQLALDGHVDVLTNRANVDLRQLNVRVERMAGVPSLGASFTTQQQAMQDDLDFFGAGSNWYPSTLWGLQLNVPIFSGFQRHNKVQQAKIDVERARRQLDQVKESIQLQVSTERANYASALDVYKTQEDNMALAKKINRVTHIKYEEGVASSLDIQQTETQMLDAQRGFLQAAHEVIKTRAALEKALDIKR